MFRVVETRVWAWKTGRWRRQKNKNEYGRGQTMVLSGGVWFARYWGLPARVQLVLGDRNY